MLYLEKRHETLSDEPWSEIKASATIDTIVQQCLALFQADNLWPLHPDLIENYDLKQTPTSLWHGTAGTIWALTQLHLTNNNLPSVNFEPYLDLLINRQSEWLSQIDASLKIDPATPGYLLGYTGAYMVQWRIKKDPNILNKIEQLIQTNINNPNNELMWAAPGMMLVALFLHKDTKEKRWLDLYHQAAIYMLSIYKYDENIDSKIWTQYMYGSEAKHLGLVHGFAGNAVALLKGIHLFEATQQRKIIDDIERTFINTAIVEDELANWLPCVGKPRPGREDMLVHICHGAPGMAIGLADLWELGSKKSQALLLKAGNLVWAAGPLEKPWGLCHGTAGNGYVFLKLYDLTKEEIWLTRARQFGMHAIKQYEQAAEKYGMIRTDAWCGDLGLALFLQSCIAQNSEFPMIDYF
ncbi:MAG: lanthionine synthetase [Legionellales bacterium]|nr:lanthionine synthetase [Legionellales bacterium]